MKSAKLASQLMERSGGRCELCGYPITNCAHAHRLVWGGAYVLENVINLCYVCHMIKIHGFKTMKIKESQLRPEQVEYIVSHRSRIYKYVKWGE
jgi:hypothetical protein